MLQTFLIFCGAGLGGVCRFWVASFFYELLGKAFPYGTVIVNISGCFLMGVLFALIEERFANVEISLRALLLVGFLGGYTTFSSFSIETMMLFERGAYESALLNIFLSVVLCILATWFGLFIARQ